MSGPDVRKSIRRSGWGLIIERVFRDVAHEARIKIIDLVRRRNVCEWYRSRRGAPYISVLWECKVCGVGCWKGRWEGQFFRAE